jgi:hypothetical protein
MKLKAKIHLLTTPRLLPTALLVYLNIEKRNQNIRDDILEMNNYSPSYTRQGDWGAGGGGGWGADE